MAKVEKRPPIKETVGALYYCFDVGPDYTGTFETDVYSSEVVKNISRAETGTTTPVYASGKIYENRFQASSIDQTVNVVAFDAKDIAKMRGEQIDETTGLVVTKSNPTKPFFAFGKVVKLSGGEERWEWYPKCQLTENTDDIATSEASFSEQTDTLTIQALPFNEAGDFRTFIDTSIANPKNITEEKFFSKVVLTSADLA